MKRVNLRICLPRFELIRMFTNFCCLPGVQGYAGGLSHTDFTDYTDSPLRGLAAAPKLSPLNSQFSIHNRLSPLNSQLSIHNRLCRLCPNIAK